MFGLSAGPPPDRFLVGLATLTLFAEVAEQQPLVCIVDDAQWLDRASAQILGFVARRLLAERIALVCAARTGIGDDVLAGLPELPIGGLGDSDARALLLDNVHGPLDAAVCDQIVTESHGNPLALLELPRSWNVADLAGGFGLPGSQPVGEQDRTELRPAAQPASRPRRGCSSSPRPQSRSATRCCSTVPPRRSASTWLRPARRWTPVCSKSVGASSSRTRSSAPPPTARPLPRTAIASIAPSPRRPILEPTRIGVPGTAPAQRPGPDEEVAAELERSAGRAQARGGVAAAAAFLTRATELTPDPALRSERALAAAFANVQAGSFATARRMLGIAHDGPVDELQRARIDMLRAHLAFASSRGNEATPLLLAAARRLEPLDLKLARETYLDAFSAALFGARLNDTRRRARGSRGGSSRAAPAQMTRPRLPTCCWMRWWRSLMTTTRPLRRAGTPCANSPATRSRPRNGCGGCGRVASSPWKCGTTRAHTSCPTTASRLARETGTLSELALALSARTPVLVFCGELSAAASAVADTQSVQEATGISSAPYGALILAAWRGDEREAQQLIESTIREAGARGEGIGLAIAEYARAVLCNGLGQYEKALVAARSASEYREVVAENWGLSELIEPAARTGRTDLATEGLNRLAEKARASGTDWALGIEARSRALLSDGATAEGLFREGNRASEPNPHARRARPHSSAVRRVASTDESPTRTRAPQLDVAHELFSAMGMEQFAERARRELAGRRGDRAQAQRRDARRADRTGSADRPTRARRSVESRDRRPALLSPRTVEWHLRKVFGKLGISSRRQLRAALSEDGRPVARLSD